MEGKQDGKEAKPGSDRRGGDCGKGLPEEVVSQGVLKTELEVLRAVKGQGTFQAKEKTSSKRRTERRERSPSV